MRKDQALEAAEQVLTAGRAKRNGIRTIRDAQRFLFGGMRVDAESFKSMDTDLLDEIAEISRRRSVMRCAEVVRDLVS